MNHWENELGKLRGLSTTRERMEIAAATNPEYYFPRIKLINNFFSRHPSPVDIAFLLEGALKFAYLFAGNFEGNNILFFRPRSRHKIVEESFLIGEPHPERTLLLVDEDLVMGVAMEDSARFFVESRYKPQNMYVYLNEGWGPEQYRPVLGPLEKFKLGF